MEYSYIRKKQRLNHLILRNKEKFVLKRRASKSRSDLESNAIPATKEHQECVVGSEKWLLDELEMRWRVKVAFLRTERYGCRIQKALVNMTLKRQGSYTELSTAVYAQTSFEDVRDIQLHLFATSELNSVLALPLYKSSKYSPSTLVVVEQGSVLEFNPTLATLNTWLDAVTKEGSLDFSRHQEWLHGCTTVEQNKLHFLLKKFMQLEAKLVTGAVTLYLDEDRSSFFALDAVLLANNMIDRDVLDTLLLRHPALSQTFAHLASCYKRGRFAVVCAGLYPRE